MNKKEFDKMIEAENKRAGANKINAYQCISKCANLIWTKDADSGTTPFMISCPHCGGTARSEIYRVSQTAVPTHEFYRPSFEEFQKLFGATKTHVEMGGLLFRKIEKLSTTESAHKASSEQSEG